MTTDTLPIANVVSRQEWLAITPQQTECPCHEPA